MRNVIKYAYSFLIMITLAGCAAKNNRKTVVNPMPADINLPIILGETDGEVSSITLVRVEENDETASRAGNGDIFLYYEIEREHQAAGYPTYIDGMMVHFIPDKNNRYRVKERLVTSEYSTMQEGMKVFNAIVHSTEESTWVAKGFANQSPIYSKLLAFYLSGKCDQ